METASAIESYRTRSPVLFLIHARPAVTRRVFEAIRRARPARLYVAADGARPSRAGEEERCLECRKIASEIDWDCEVQTLFRAKNMGSAAAIPEAINWFFGLESEGIILEDDCLPSADFFRFCDELLVRHRDDDKVMVISGSNFMFTRDSPGTPDYLYSSYSVSWGWATWSRAWQHYGRAKAEDLGAIVRAGLHRPTAIQLHWIFLLRYAFEIPNWDYRWLAAFWGNSGLCAIPTSNLISNIGFGPDAVHTVNPDDERAELPLEVLGRSVSGPDALVPDDRLDTFLERVCYRISWRSTAKIAILSKVPALRKLKKYLR